TGCDNKGLEEGHEDDEEKRDKYENRGDEDMNEEERGDERVGLKGDSHSPQRIAHTKKSFKYGKISA
ncbi:unnamed protein product, partial [Ilex paraguariensis]